MNSRNEPIPTSEWFILYLLMLIPIFNLIKLIMMSGDKEISPILSNWAKATLIMGVVSVVLGIVINVAVLGLIRSLL